jgi:hypothetical protein
VSSLFEFMVRDLMDYSMSVGIVPVIHDIQRTSKGLYAAVTSMLTDVNVDGRDVDRFYFESEYIFLNTHDGVAIITTEFPSIDRRSHTAVDSSQMLETLRVVS